MKKITLNNKILAKVDNGTFITAKELYTPNDYNYENEWKVFDNEEQAREYFKNEIKEIEEFTIQNQEIDV